MRLVGTKLHLTFREWGFNGGEVDYITTRVKCFSYFLMLDYKSKFNKSTKLVSKDAESGNYS